MKYLQHLDSQPLSKILKKDRYVRIGCDGGGEYRINKLPVKKRDTTVRRTTRTRLIQCPFEI